MPGQVRVPAVHRLVWFYPDSLGKKLNARPTLAMTRGLRQLGWKVDLLVGGLDGPSQIQGVEVTGIPRPEMFLVKQVDYHLKAMKHVLDRWGETRVVLFQSMSLPWLLALRLAGALRRGPRPLLLMDTRTLQMEKRNWKDRLRGYFSSVMGILANWFIDGQTAITPRMAQALRIPESKLWGTWPSGVDVDIFAPAVPLRHWPHGDEPIQIVYIGTLAPGRELLPLCRAVEKVNQEGPHFELSLFGSGNDQENLAAFAATTSGRVRLLGQVPYDQMPLILAKMHVGALPFPDRQEFRVSSPIKLFEYMAAGMPILATRIVCHTDVLRDAACVFWAEDSSVECLTDALRSLWNNRLGLPAQGELSAQLAQHHTWSASASRLAQAMEHGIALQESSRA